MDTVATAPRSDREIKIWLACAGLAILLHILAFLIPWKRILAWQTTDWSAPPVEIKPFDPSALESLRKEWRDKKLLLSKDENPAKDDTPAKDAEYLSDRNRQVEKEQRAQRTDVIPKPGSAASSPKLKDLGVRMNPPRERGRGAQVAMNDTPPSPSEASDPGADQTLLDYDLPLGAENLLNTERSVYYSYYSRLYQAIGPIWQSRVRDVPYMRAVAPGDYTTWAEVTFDRYGSLVGVRFERSSGISEFDEAVTASWRRVRRFPNPPQDLIEKDGFVHTRWTFTISVDSNASLLYQNPRVRRQN